MGMGQLIESTLTCIGVAWDLDAEYIGTRLKQKHAHGLSPHTFNSWFGLAHAFPIQNASMKLRVVPRNVTQFGSKCGGSATNGPMKPSWLMGVEDSASLCQPDGSSVYGSEHCWDRFWCGTIKRTPSSWYAALRFVRANAYYASPKAKPHLAHERHATTRGAVHVVIHYRSVKRRRLKNGFYMAVLYGLIKRHATYVDAMPAGQTPPRLRLEFHGDQDPKASSMIRQLMHAAANGTIDGRGLTDLKVHSVVADSLSFEATLNVHHQLVECDLLVPSHSSFSMSAALLGNMSVLFPACDARTPLPHWWPIPCEDGVSSTGRPAVTIAGQLHRIPWPPPPNYGGRSLVHHRDRLRARASPSL